MYIFIKKNYCNKLVLKLTNSICSIDTKHTIYVNDNLTAVNILDHLVDLYVIL